MKIAIGYCRTYMTGLAVLFCIVLYVVDSTPGDNSIDSLALAWHLPYICQTSKISQVPPSPGRTYPMLGRCTAAVHERGKQVVSSDTSAQHECRCLPLAYRAYVHELRTTSTRYWSNECPARVRPVPGTSCT